MNLLLDTHIALWAVYDHPRLPGKARELITDMNNEVAVSAASIWEIAIKHAITRRGARAMPVSASDAMSLFKTAGYHLLAITPSHAAAVDGLAPLHADPFDRMLAAQALSEPLRLVTHDPAVAQYSDTIILV